PTRRSADLDFLPRQLQLRYDRRRRARRHVAAGEPARPIGLGLRQTQGRLAEMLVLEKAPDQLRTRVLQLACRVDTSRQQHLRLDAYERGRHLEKLAGPVESDFLHCRDRAQELLGDLRDGDVEYVDVLLPDQVQEQVERTGKAVQL